jgi:hypothetical protein
MRTLEEDLKDKIKVMSQTIWEGKANGPQIDTWLSNFTGQVIDIATERRHALYWLSRYMYYGVREVEALLRAIYLDLFRYPLIEAARKKNGDTRDQILLSRLFNEELSRTRFLPFGGMAKSGAMLLYHFRHITGLSEELFAAVEGVEAKKPECTPPTATRYVFIDDLLGSGDQASSYMKRFVAPIRDAYGSSVEISYFVMFATEAGVNLLRASHKELDRIEAVHVLDDSFKCFDSDTRYYPAFGLDSATGKSIASLYGSRVDPHPLGYKDSQLLLGFFYNTPDNTLPVIWSRGSSWKPIFGRL